MATKNEDLQVAAEEYRTKIYEFYNPRINNEEDNYDAGMSAIICDEIPDAFRAGAEWQKEQSKQGWISVKDELPKFNKNVLVLEDGNIKVAQYCKQFMSDRTYWTTDYGRLITHWMPIPEIPKGGKE